MPSSVEVLASSLMELWTASIRMNCESRWVLDHGLERSVGELDEGNSSPLIGLKIHSQFVLTALRRWWKRGCQCPLKWDLLLTRLRTYCSNFRWDLDYCQSAPSNCSRRTRIVILPSSKYQSIHKPRQPWAVPMVWKDELLSECSSVRLRSTSHR